MHILDVTAKLNS